MDCHLITSLTWQLTRTPVPDKAGPSGKACSENPHCCQYNPSCNQLANHRTDLCFSKIMGKSREGLVRKRPCSQNIVNPSSWAQCSVLGFRREHFAFCKCAFIFAYFPLFQRKFLLLKVLARLWKANTKNRCEGKGVYVGHGCCMKYMLSKELGWSSQEELQGTESFWKFGFRSHSNTKKRSKFSPVL